ncbi:MAG: nuclear transport factor 2 family protein [Acidimicrobiales bacterium]
MALEDDKQTVHELLDGIARRDVSALERVVTDDVVWWVPRSASRHGLARPLVGRSAVVELLRGSSEFFRADTTTWTVIAMIGEGTSVVAHVERRCLTSAGIEYLNDYLLRFDFDGGQIREAWEQTDTALAFELFASRS